MTKVANGPYPGSFDLVDLDKDELFHLAIRASNQDDHDRAIIYLKNALKLSNEAKVRFMLAAEHAEIGMYEQAIAGMREAIELQPTLWIAHFQIGLIYITIGQPEAAIEAWQGLASLAEDHPLYLFQAGLTAIIGNQTETGIALLEKGIAANLDNPPLNVDMQRVISSAQKSFDEQQSEGQSDSQTTALPTDQTANDDSDDANRERDGDAVNSSLNSHRRQLYLANYQSDEKDDPS